MELEIKFSSSTLKNLSIYKQQDSAMFGNLFCEIELGGGVVF